MKLHRQFSHPHSERLLSLLLDCEINDEELKSHIKDLDEKCFGHPNKIFVDNGREFNNTEFQTLCENFNIRICTAAAETPWSNSLIERHNVVLGQQLLKPWTTLSVTYN